MGPGGLFMLQNLHWVAPSSKTLFLAKRQALQSTANEYHQYSTTDSDYIYENRKEHGDSLSDVHHAAETDEDTDDDEEDGEEEGGGGGGDDINDDVLDELSEERFKHYLNSTAGKQILIREIEKLKVQIDEKNGVQGGVDMSSALEPSQKVTKFAFNSVDTLFSYIGGTILSLYPGFSHVLTFHLRTICI